MSSVTDLHLKTRDHVRIWVNDQLVGEVVVGAMEGRDALLQEVEHARRLEVLPGLLAGLKHRLASIPNIGDHVHTSPAAKQQAFARGLMDGLNQCIEPFPGTLNLSAPPVRPEGSPAYSAGYDYGEALAEILAAVERVAVQKGGGA